MIIISIKTIKKVMVEVTLLADDFALSQILYNFFMYIIIMKLKYFEESNWISAWYYTVLD